MKISLASKLVIGGLFLTMFSNFECKKEVIDQLCSKERQLFLPVDNKSGTVTYIAEFQVYAILLDNNITAVVCKLDPSLQKEGQKVTVSGTLKYFNPDEVILTKGKISNAYFLELKSIK